jgi:hypothetical protein
MLRAVPSWSPSLGTVTAFVLGGWGVGASLALVALVARARLFMAIPQVSKRRALLGAIDGAALSALLVFLYSPALLQGTLRRVAAFVVFSALGAVLGHFLSDSRKRVSAALMLFGAAYFVATLPPHADALLRVILHGVMAVATATCLRIEHPRSQLYAVGTTLAFVFAFAAATLLQHAPAARSALAIRSSHARTWTGLIERMADGDGDLATNLFGGRDCDPSNGDVYPGATEVRGNGRDDNCEGGDGAAPLPRLRPRAYGAASGRDILIVSLDSLRFDVADELRRTREVLGPHTELTHAVSPTPKTVTSISATLRGRPFRQLELASAPGVRNLVPVNGVSLGEVLASAGYRALTVPTHRYLNEQGRVLAGFEMLLPTEAELNDRFVPASSAIELVTKAIAGSPAPACVFLHLMESHHPYRYGDQRGPDSIIGLRNAVRYLDAAIAAMITQVTQIRGGRAPVVAVLGDHGEEFDEHGGRFHATTAFAEQVRVAWLLAGPGVPGGSFDAPVSTAALPATLLDLVGVATPDAMTERSLLPFLSGEVSPPDVAVSEVRAGLKVIGYSFGTHRLLTDSARSAHMLFDSDRDPFETVDLAEQHPQLLRDLLARARRWDEQH